MDATTRLVARLTRRLADLERRVENGVRHAVVRQVDAKKQRVRLALGKDVDGSEQLSPWVPYSQVAGALKHHSPPSVGQTLTLISPGGDFTQGVALPLTWSDQNKSPSDKPDEHVMTFGDLKIVHTKDKTTIARGDTAIEWTKDGITARAKLFTHEGDRVEHGGRNIGKDHLHSHVTAGPDKTDVPDE
jgi:phage baseplate assembly protein V